jgi:copper chaperone CopZ
MIIPGMNAVPDTIVSVTPASNSPPVLDIYSPQENEVIMNDIVPPHVWISGEVKNLSRIRSITITSSEGSTDCSNDSSFGCNVKVRTGPNRIIITVTDSTGNQVSGTRDFTVISGGITQPPRITISGRITSADGLPIEGAVIRLESDTAPVTTESGTDGAYRISNAYGYSQKMCVEKTGYANVTREMTFDRNLNTLDFTMVPATRPAYSFSAVLCLVVLMGIVLTIVYRNNS